MSNQVFAHGIKNILHDPQALVETLRAKFNVEPEVEPANQVHLSTVESLGQLSFWL